MNNKWSCSVVKNMFFLKGFVQASMHTCIVLVLIYMHLLKGGLNFPFHNAFILSLGDVETQNSIFKFFLKKVKISSKIYQNVPKSAVY